MELKEFIYNIPKAELHVHLEGTLEPELKLKLADKNSVDIGYKSVEAIKNSYNFTDLPSFLDLYYEGMKVLIDEEDFYELALNYLKRAKENNVRHVELFFDPQAHTSRGVDFDTVINGYYRAVKEAKELDIDAKLIMCFLRDLSEESAIEHYNMAKNHREKILAIGLDSDEKGNPPRKFERVFNLAKEDGFKITMHCDVDQENSIEHIRECLDLINVNRIDHGTNIIEDENLVEKAIKNKIGLTSCPISNKIISEGNKSKEVKKLLDKGVLISINSDDPAYFQGYVSDNILEVSRSENLDIDNIVKLVKNSFEMSWITEEDRNKYFEEIDEFVKLYN